MSYLYNTVAYLFKYGKGKRFLTVFLLTLIPSAIISYAYPFSAYADFLFGYIDSDFPSFGVLWLSAFRHDTYALIGLALTFVSFVMFTAYITTVITRSVRVGEFGLTKIINSVNENFFPAIAVTVFYGFTLFLMHNLFILLAFLFLQLKSRVFGLVLTVFFFLLTAVITVYFWSAFTLWLPTMSFSGQYVTKAFVSSFYKSRSYQRHFFLPSLIMFAFLLAVSVAAHFITVWYARWIFNTLCIAVLYTFVITFTTMAYCETESITREDMVKRYFRR